jgi:hypothetical protein
MEEDAEDEMAGDPNAQLEMEIRGAGTGGRSEGYAGRPASEDVEMS